LEHKERYILKKNTEALAEEDLVPEIKRRCSNPKNSRLPDIQELFTRELTMDLGEDNTEARILM